MGFSPNVGSGNISGAEDVALSNPLNDQVLSYDSTTALWTNKTASTATAITNVTGNVVMYSSDPAVRGTSDTTKVVIFITSTQPTAMINNDIWLNGSLI